MANPVSYGMNCIICGQNSSRFFREKDGWRLVKCPNDGLIYVNLQPTPEDLMEFYNSGKYFHSDVRPFFKNVNFNWLERFLVGLARKTRLDKVPLPVIDGQILFICRKE